MQEPQNKQQNQGGLSWNEPAKKTTSAPTPVTPVSFSKKISTTPVDEKNNVATVIGVLAAAIIVGSVGAWAISAMKGSDTTVATGTTTTKTTNNSGVLTATGSPTNTETITSGAQTSLNVASEQRAGLQVMVTDAAASTPTWVVVYENNNGTPGNALGAGLFFPGNQSGAIELLRGTIAGRTYFVGQSIDNGDKAFSLQTDRPVVDQSGKPILLQFQTN